MADLRGGPNSFNFIVFWEKLAKSYVGASPGELAPPPRGNPGSATDSGTVILLHSFEILVDDLRGGDQEGPQIIY